MLDFPASIKTSVGLKPAKLTSRVRGVLMSVESENLPAASVVVPEIIFDSAIKRHVAPATAVESLSDSTVAVMSRAESTAGQAATIKSKLKTCFM